MPSDTSYKADIRDSITQRAGSRKSIRIDVEPVHNALAPLDIRAQVADAYARSYADARKKTKSLILDEVTALTGWSRDNARRRLSEAGKHPSGHGEFSTPRKRKPKPRKYSAEAHSVLHLVWKISGGQSGKYLAVSLRTYLDGLEHHGELMHGQNGYGDHVRNELLSMSPASIDRYLASARHNHQLACESSIARTPLQNASFAMLRSSSNFAPEPGLFDCETIEHCGTTRSDDCINTLHLTCVHTGWVFTHSIERNSRAHVLSGLQTATSPETGVPFAVSALAMRNASQPVIDAISEWTDENGICFYPIAGETKRDVGFRQHLVHAYGYTYQYDTNVEQQLLNRLWLLVNDRLNFLTPTKKPIGWTSGHIGRRKRLYDAPATPCDRLLAARVISPAQEAELIAYRASINPAALAREISCLQNELSALKTPCEVPGDVYSATVHH